MTISVVFSQPGDAALVLLVPEAEPAVEAAVSKHLPLHALISAMALMTFDGARWVCLREFALSRSEA